MLEWATLWYSDANEGIQMQDKAANRLIAKGMYSTTNFTSPIDIQHTIELEARNGRMRVTFSDFAYVPEPGSVIPFESGRVPWRDRVIEKALEYVSSAVEDLRNHLNAEAGNDEW